MRSHKFKRFFIMIMRGAEEGARNPKTHKLKGPSQPMSRPVALALLVAACASTTDAATPWPHPATISEGKSTISLRDFNFSITNPPGAHKHLHRRARQLTDAIRGANGEGAEELALQLIAHAEAVAGGGAGEAAQTQALAALCALAAALRGQAPAAGGDGSDED